MNLEQQCTSLELSKRLKELDVKQDGLFFYNKQKFGNYLLGNCPNYIDVGDEHYSAFTAAELLQLLPYHITSHEPEPFNSYRLYISGSVIVKNPECIDPVRIHIVNYESDTYDMNSTALAFNMTLTKNLWDENPANALGKMLIFLYETGLLKND